RASDMTIGALRERADFGGWGLGLVVVEVVITPAVGLSISLSVFDRHVGAVKGPREEPASGWFFLRTVREVGGQHELQFLHKYRSFGEHARLLVNVVRTRLDVDVMEFRKVCLATVQCVWRQG